MATIAFMGLGRMGSGMAEQLLKAGHKVAVWNRSSGKIAALAAKGARAANSPADAAAGADAVITMLADDPAAERVWLAPDGALAVMKSGAIAIECSTLTRQFVLELGHRMAAKGIRFIDSPVTGRPNVAAQGKLTMLVGASPEDLAAARPYLDLLGETIRHFGPVGAGTAYKLMINLMGAVQIAALAEGLNMAERLGLDRNAVKEAIADSAAASRQVVYHVGRMSNRDFADPTFTAALRYKDAAYAAELAQEVGAAIPLGETSVVWFAAAKLLEADGDEARVIDCVKERSGNRA